ncbi:MAG: aspartate racemase [Chloroflexota bacterium]|nr:aspartate racemase [Chloroflexota bacterium]
MTAPAADRVLGIVGGVGPESTIDYYRSLVAAWRRRRPDGSYPRVIIDSVDAGQVMRFLGEGEFGAVGRALGAALGELAAAGCGCALIASNATHLAFDVIDPPPSMPMIHIVEAARDAAVAAGHHRLGLIGTRYVMQSRLYPDRFEPAGLSIVLPTPAEQDLVHAIYMNELVLGEFRDDSRERLVAVIASMRDRDSIDSVILGGTELALTLTEPAYADVPILNTAQIHVEAAAEWLLGGEEMAP